MCNRLVLACVYFVLFEFCVKQYAEAVRTSVGEIIGETAWIQVKGHVKSVQRYLGIPYAESTAGNARFLKPVPKAPFTQPFHATAYPPSCSASSSSFSEDCLALNVFVPGEHKNGTQLPVMVWIHGGGFKTGTSNSHDPGALCIFGNVIVVTINYRLGIFGFLRTSNGDLPGNQGLWDQHLAIKWVHDNIQSFGGDPDLVTLFGQSAGSKSVIYQALYAGNKGMFRRIIAESGSALSQRAIMTHPNGDHVLLASGCADGHSDPYACLRSKSVFGLHKIKGDFLPTVDGNFVVEKPYDIVYGNSSQSAEARLFFKKLDLIAGVCTFDGGLLLTSVYDSLLHQDVHHLDITYQQFKDVIIPWAVKDTFEGIDNETRRRLEELLAFEYTDWDHQHDSRTILSNVVNMTSDFTYFKSTIQTVIGHQREPMASTFLYEFAVNPSHHLIYLPGSLHGPNHEDEIPFVYGEPVSNVSTKHFHSYETVISEVMMAMWTNFAKTGNPNHPVDISAFFNGSAWTQYDSQGTQSFLRLTNHLSSDSMRSQFYPHRMSIWLDKIPKLLQTGAQLQPSTGLVIMILDPRQSWDGVTGVCPQEGHCAIN